MFRKLAKYLGLALVLGGLLVTAVNAAGSDSFAITVTIISWAATPEISGITLNSGALYTNDRLITVTATVTAGSPVQMRLAENSSFTANDTGWLTFQNPASYTLTAGDGLKTVYYKVRDAVLSESAVRSASITLDTAQPSVLSVTPANGAAGVPVGTTVALTFSKAMDRTLTQRAFSLTGQYGVVGGFSWSSDQTKLTFTPRPALSAGATYAVTLDATATDSRGYPLAAPFRSSFTTVAGDIKAPVISIRINGVPIKSGDYIPKQPLITIRVTDEAPGHPLDAQLYLDDIQMPVTINQLSEQVLEANYQVARDLKGEQFLTHSIRATAQDMAGNAASREATGLKVSYAGPRLTEPPIVSETPFQPAHDGSKTMFIAYSLTEDSNTLIMLVGLGGETLWTRRYPAGQEGGRAGYNAVVFNGISDLSNTPLANGIYVYQIVANGQAIGRGHIVIY